MTPKTLTETQASEIALALLGINPHLKAYDPEFLESRLDIRGIIPTARTTQMGIKVYFDISQKGRSDTEWKAVRYQLYIGYYETVGQFNPAIISLFYILDANGEEEMMVEVLCNLALVTDKLRQFGVW